MVSDEEQALKEQVAIGAVCDVNKSAEKVSSAPADQKGSGNASSQENDDSWDLQFAAAAESQKTLPQSTRKRIRLNSRAFTAAQQEMDRSVRSHSLVKAGH